MDVLFHLRREQIVLRAEEIEPLEVDGQSPTTDMMASLARHVLQHRRFVFILFLLDSIHYCLV